MDIAKCLINCRCSFLSGLAAGSFAALFVNPLDVVKTRLQAIKKADGEKEFKGIVDCIRYVVVNSK